MGRTELTILTWLWRPTGTWRQDYNHNHVNALREAFKQHLHRPHRFVCVTDMPNGIKCETLPLWKEPAVNVIRSKPNCYKRLRVFGKDAAKILGTNKFVSVDLDCVVLKDITGLFNGNDDFKILAGSACPYNGSLWMLKTGARPSVWHDFDPKRSPDIANRVKKANGKKYFGSDQAWISYKIPFEPTWGPADGVYQFTRDVKRQGIVPENARMVFFAGRRKPWHPEMNHLNRTLYATYRKHYRAGIAAS